MNPWEKSISFAPIANSSSTGLEPYNDHTRDAMVEALTSALTSRTMMTNGWSRLPRSTAKGTYAENPVMQSDSFGHALGSHIRLDHMAAFST